MGILSAITGNIDRPADSPSKTTTDRGLPPKSSARQLSTENFKAERPNNTSKDSDATTTPQLNTLATQPESKEENAAADSSDERDYVDAEENNDLSREDGHGPAIIAVAEEEVMTVPGESTLVETSVIAAVVQPEEQAALDGDITPTAGNASKTLADDEGMVAPYKPENEGTTAVVAKDSAAPSVNGNLDKPVRPTLDEQPSRSYISRPTSTIMPATASRPASTIVPAPPALNETIVDRAPAVLERDADGQPKVIDASTASPANLGDREHMGGVITLPAGGALQQGSVHESVRPETTNEAAAAQEAASVRESTTAETPAVAATTVTNSFYEGSGPDGDVRNLMNEGQAYRSDGGVPGQPAYQDGAGYNQVAGGTAGGAITAQQADAYRAEQQARYPQAHQNDPTFAAERAMSPGPNDMGFNRLAIQDPPVVQTTTTVGPSPGPPVTAFSPTAATPLAKRVTTSAAAGANGADLGRSQTYRTGVSRGSTVRRGGAFANGSALSGGGAAETYGREDIHNRNDLATRNLIAAGRPGAAVSRKISSAEKKDAKRMSKLIKNEGETERAAVRAAMRELEQLQKVQKAAAYVSVAH